MPGSAPNLPEKRREPARRTWRKHSARVVKAANPSSAIVILRHKTIIMRHVGWSIGDGSHSVWTSPSTLNSNLFSNTGDVPRARINLPNGFEYTVAESGTTPAPNKMENRFIRDLPGGSREACRVRLFLKISMMIRIQAGTREDRRARVPDQTLGLAL